MTKKAGCFLLLCMALVVMGGCVSDRTLSAGKDLYTAVTISNEELIQLSKDMRAVGDQENKVASPKDKYGARLARLTNRFKKEDGLDLNFKAYITKEVNANATADGSIRVYSGLMDMLTDNELIFIVGHEIGHVKDGDTLDKIRVSYASSGAIKAAGAAHAGVAALTSSQLGELLHTAVNAQFSQQQEYDADEYGFSLMRKYKIDLKAAVSALRKIDKLGASGGVMASHPNSAARADRLEAKIKAGK